MAAPSAPAVDKTAISTLVHASRIDPDSALRNTKTVPRKFRVLVLDARSGLPVRRVPAMIVKVDGTEAVRYQWERTGWDIVENRAFFGDMGPITAQRMMNAMGYDCGTPSKAFGPKATESFIQFQDEWYDDHPDQKRPDKPLKVPNAAWYGRIKAEYNRCCHAQTQFHLTSLGYDCAADNGEWKDKSVKAFQDWQRIELGIGKPAKNLTTQDLAQKLVDARKRFMTDADGVLHVPVAASKITAGFTVEVQFFDFAIAAESKDAKRTARGASPTGFGILYKGGQTDKPTESKQPWGWFIAQGDKEVQLTTSVEWKIGAGDVSDPSGNPWIKLHASKKDASPFSPYYPAAQDQPDHPEAAVFALVWCQPVWDDIDDPEGSTQINDTVYVQDRSDRGHHMHVVTMWSDLGGWDPYGGKGYGIWEQASNPRYRGADKPLTVKGALARLKFLGYDVGFDPETGEVHDLTLDELEETYKNEVEEYIAGMGTLPIGACCMAAVANFQKENGLPETGTLDHAVSSSDARDEATYQQLDAQTRPRRAEWDDPKDGHAGIDVHVHAGNYDNGKASSEGSPVFAVHGGTIKTTKAWTGSAKAAAGNLISVKWEGTSYNLAEYLHLDQLKAQKNDRVKAGQIIARAGRTGNFGNRAAATSDFATLGIYPSHLHFNVGWNNQLRNAPDEHNQGCIPHNGSPLLLPCACEVPPGASNAKDCKFANTGFVSTCWAVAELRCPHMPVQLTVGGLAGPGPGAEIRRLQAQLRYLREQHLRQGRSGEGLRHLRTMPDPDDAPYLSPGEALDGKLTAKTKDAIKRFKKTHGLGEGDSVTQPFIDALNTRAPVGRNFPD